MGDLVGKTVGNYEILDQVGQGSMGVVFKAMQLSMNRVVALKVLPTKLAEDQTYVARFVSEARAAGQISHPNIVGVYDVVKFANTYAFSMDFVDGETVQKRIDDLGPIPEKEALAITRQIAAALAAAHSKGILHRDVKPDNIMIDFDGTAKLADLGLARAFKPGRGSTTAGQSSGTPHYMAPEEAKAEPVDFRADLYSLGATLFHMVTGEPPFDAPTAAAVIIKHATEEPPDARDRYPNVSVACSRLVRRLMAKDPDERPKGAIAVLAAIDKVLAGDPGDETSRHEPVGASPGLPDSVGTAKLQRVTTSTRYGESRGTAKQERVRARTRSTQITEAPEEEGRNWVKTGIIAAASLVLAAGLVFYIIHARRKAAERRRQEAIRLADEQKKEQEAEVRRKAEEAALEAREAFEEIEDWCEKNPEDLPEWRRRYEEYLKEHPKAADAERARGRIEDIKRTIAEKRAEEELTRLIARAKAKAATGKYGEAMELLRERAQGAGALATKAHAAADEILGEARKRFNELKARADELSDAGTFAAAKAKLRPVIRDYGVDELVSAAEAACKEYDQLSAEAELAADRKCVEGAAGKAAKLAAVRRYADAREALLIAQPKISDPELKAKARELAMDYDNAEKAYSHTKMRLEIGSRTKLALIGLRRGHALAIEDNGLKVERGGRVSVLPWTEVPNRSVAKLAVRNMTRTDGTDYRNVGVLAMLLGAWPEAKEMLTKADTLDPELHKDVERYMAVVEPEIAATDERTAEELFEQAKDNTRKRLTVRVAYQVKELKEKYSHTRFYKARAAEIEGLLGGKVVASKPEEGEKDDPNDPAAQLRKLGWSTVQGNWKIEGRGLFVGEGEVRLESESNWHNMGVKASVHMMEGEKFCLLVRYRPGLSTFGNAPPGYGVVVEQGRIRAIGGSRGYYFGLGSSTYSGRPEEQKVVLFRGTIPHTYTITLEERNLSIFVDGQRLYKHQLAKHRSGSVALFGSGVKLKVRDPVAKELP